MKNLENILRPGYLVNRKILYSYGLARPDVDYYVRSGFLTSFARGVYHRKSDYNLTSHEIIASLEDLGYSAHVGGFSVVSEAGLDHFVSVRDTTPSISLYSAELLPKWLINQSFPILFTSTKQSWLSKLPNSVYRKQSFSQWNRDVKYATLELAMLEQLVDAKLESDIVAIDRQLEGMPNLSPKRLNELLRLCPNIKAKRLFGWLSQRHDHAWIKRIEWNTVDLGKGKRSITKGGRYNDQWQITVPRKMEDQTVYGH